MTTQGQDAAASDHRLVVAAQAGDRAAFDALVLRYRPHIEGFVRREVGDAVRAADLTQDTFDEAYENLAQVRRPGAFNAWLHRIAYNRLLLDQRRRPLVALDQAPAAPGPPAAPRKRLRVQHTVAGLTPPLHEVLLLHDVSGYTIPEIAARLHISTDAAQKRLYRARVAFRTRYANDDAAIQEEEP